MTNQVLDKLTTRSILALSMTIYLGGVLFYVLTRPITSDNSLILLVLGILSTNFTTIIIFYFRKAQSKETKTSGGNMSHD